MIDGFEWDLNKAQGNIEKHGVSFEEAISVFWDEQALLIADPEHSSFNEDRFILLGISEQLRLLVVVHCERNENIRIISARTATPKERKQYESLL